MTIQSWLSTIRQSRVIGVIRTPRWDWGLPMAKAAIAGGVQLIEITWNSDRPGEVIQQLRQECPHAVIGAGTLLTVAQVEAAIAAGAQFLFTPHVNPILIQTAIAQDIPLVAGALTPTEIVTAWQAGATCVKVFPVQAVGGAEYVRCLQGPLGEIPLIPTGGVTLANTMEFLQAGAIAVGLSGDLFPRQAIQTERWDVITQRAATLFAKL
ncbi:MAG: bifunctional 4-hydroxy-2-oxoglutarate aldolase/2-dehydro-3-deoxy-phosphogluconate aldolase [Leptolyngbyaceae cyanobacterium bins.349]|nr:bifunctional 4-hydroxy-2-oxoglutarate aldolase/2-dehydro-3-deoxy-phosphogluconate aldolase [Leptolyngbyaceae cyanobacterium bins.349]